MFPTRAKPDEARPSIARTGSSSVALLMSMLIVKIPVVLLLTVAVVSALRASDRTEPLPVAQDRVD